MAKKKYYVQNTQKMIVTIDPDVKPTAAEEHIVKMLIASGYKVQTKSQDRAEQARKRVKKETIKTKADMDLSKLTKEQQSEIEKIEKEKGFFAARSYYKKCLGL